MRGDALYPPFLKHSWISRIEGDVLYVTDRRKLPSVHEEVICRNAEEAASAIKAMVTQGGGPLEVALNALLLAIRKGEDLEKAVLVLSSSRPTNTTMKRTLAAIMERYRAGEEMEELIRSAFVYYDELYDAVSDIGASLIEDGDGILTRCFPEHTFLLSVRKAVLSGKDVHVYVPETRPYLQGARLTEPSLRAMGIRCSLITDAMNAHFMAEGRIAKVMTASDLALSDRTVVNKVGTMQIAMLAKHFGIPYYVTGIPSFGHEDAKSVEIEMRSPDLVLEAMGKRIAKEGVKGLYPAFDITPSGYVTSVVTDKGVFSPREVRKYYF